MLAQGKGKQGSISSFYTTAEYYVSFYDPEGYPSPKTNLSKIGKPVLWIAGKSDRNTKFYRKARICKFIPDGQYLELNGNYKSVVGNSAVDIASWIDRL